jgi:MSHA biogenesis protein MshP
MNRLSILKTQAGFTLVQAIFILVVLGLLGGAMVRLAGVQSTTSVFALQGARAYQAARSGLEWGAARAGAGAGCTGSMPIAGFAVTVTCDGGTLFTEASTTTTVYLINATATFGAYGSPDYISRRAEMKVGFP